MSHWSKVRVRRQRGRRPRRSRRPHGARSAVAAPSPTRRARPGSPPRIAPRQLRWGAPPGCRRGVKCGRGSQAVCRVLEKIKIYRLP